MPSGIHPGIQVYQNFCARSTIALTVGKECPS
jgi:hypothetical protein